MKIASQSNSPVLITGETGTGKELVANIIHFNSPRRNKPFVKLSCAILPRETFESELFGHVKGAFTGAIKDRVGKLEEANGGTLFLDDVDDIPLDLQVKLLRFLQEGEIQKIGSNKTIQVDVRVISATKKNLLTLSEKGLFRDDLYYRLNVLPIHILPIRDRIEDIPPLFQHFVEYFGKGRIKIEQEVFLELQNYEWRGNIREIKNLAERLVILNQTGVINVGSLPTEIIKKNSRKQDNLENQSLKKYLSQIEKELLVKTLEETNYNQTKTAEKLKIPLNTLRSKLKKYGINL